MIWDRFIRKMNRFKSESMNDISQFSMRFYSICIFKKRDEDYQLASNEMNLIWCCFISPFGCEMGAEKLYQAEWDFTVKHTFDFTQSIFGIRFYVWNNLAIPEIKLCLCIYYWFPCCEHLLFNFIPPKWYRICFWNHLNISIRCWRIT